MTPPGLLQRVQASLENRDRQQLRRHLHLWAKDPRWLNLADNDYLELSSDPAVVAAAAEAAHRFGCSSSASPLITGYQPPHLELEASLCRWHGFPHGLVWNSGYSANQAILSRLPRPGDLVLADRLIHHSMVRGILQSGGRLIRYRHNDIAHLQALLHKHAANGRIVFVVTESVFSMDGDYPDFGQIAELKQRYPFFLIVDEAHATGWYGATGAGLLAETGQMGMADLLVGTLGKALGSQGAYTLFHDPLLREFLINESSEFIFSTYLSPVAAAAGGAAVQRAEELSGDQARWRTQSRRCRALLRADGWRVPDGDSPVVPVVVGESEQALAIARALRKKQILIGAVRPPTVAAGSSRLRISLKRGLTDESIDRLITALGETRRNGL